MTTAAEPGTLFGGEASLSKTPTRALSGRLGVRAIIFMVVAAAAPLTVVGGGFPIGAMVGSGEGEASMYAVGGIILLLFAVGFSTMSRYVPKPGAFFTYVGYGLGRPLGLAASWMAILTYTAIQLAVYGYIGGELSLDVQTLGGPAVPWWAYALAVTLIVGFLGYRHIELSSKVLGVLLVCEIGIVLILAAVIIATNAHGQGLSAAPFAPANALSGSPSIGLMFALAAFLGFESTAIFRNEARDPEKTIPRATYGAVILIGVFYTFASWAMTMSWGKGFMNEVNNHYGTFITDTAGAYLGQLGSVIISCLLLSSVFACVLSFHNVITRYQHSMSNASVLPKRLGSVHGSHGSPHVSSLTQTVTALVAIAAFAIAGMDGINQVFTWVSGIATLAVVMLMSLTCLAVIVYFARKRIRAGVWRTVIAPALGLLGLLVITYAMVMNFPILVSELDAQGKPYFGPITITFFIIAVAVPVAGLVQAAIMRAKKPQAYEKVIDTISAE